MTALPKHAEDWKVWMVAKTNLNGFPLHFCNLICLHWKFCNLCRSLPYSQLLTTAPFTTMASQLLSIRDMKSGSVTWTPPVWLPLVSWKVFDVTQQHPPSCFFLFKFVLWPTHSMEWIQGENGNSQMYWSLVDRHLQISECKDVLLCCSSTDTKCLSDEPLRLPWLHFRSCVVCLGWFPKWLSWMQFYFSRWVAWCSVILHISCGPSPGQATVWLDHHGQPLQLNLTSFLRWHYDDSAFPSLDQNIPIMVSSFFGPLGLFSSACSSCI